MKRALLFLSFATTLAFVTNVHATSIQLTALEDSLTLSTDNTVYHTVFGDLTASETTAGTGYWSAWLKFDLTPLVGMTVTSATLTLTTFFNHSPTSIAHEIFSSSVDSWNETSITGANQPGTGTLTSLDSTFIPNINALYDWDVLLGITGSDGLLGSNNFLTLTIRPEDLTPNVARGPHFRSSEAVSGFPILSVEFVPSSIPEPSTLLLLSCGIVLLGRRALLVNRAARRPHHEESRQGT